MRKQKKLLIFILVVIFAVYSLIFHDKNIQNVKGVHITPTPLTSEIGIFVTKVIDGDTLDVLLDGKKEKVMLIGIDTPESVDPRRPVECFGKEAARRLEELVEGKQIRLENDDTQSNRDRFGRILRYVYLRDGTFINKVLLEEGYAYEYTYQNPYKYQDEFKNAEKEARENRKGLWGEVCQ